MSTSFEPRICACSFAQFRHVVKTKADWARHLAKQRQDITANITGDVVHPPAQPQHQYPRKGTTVPVGKMQQYLAEKQRQYMVEKQPQYLVEEQLQYMELSALELPCKRGNDGNQQGRAKRRIVSPPEEPVAIESVKGRIRVSDLCTVIAVIIKSRP
jgi:hypothetical protein